jgi:hypothetical protein
MPYGDKVHIKDDYGNQVVVPRNNIPFFQESEDIPTNPMDLEKQQLRIHGEKSGQPPVRMTLIQFYELLSTLDSMENK